MLFRSQIIINQASQQQQTQQIPVVEIAHKVSWYRGDNISLSSHVNGTVCKRQWFMRNVVGDRLTVGDNIDKGYTRLDVFLLMFPPDQLTYMLRLSNANLEAAGLKATTKGELIRFIGVLILITRFEFNNRSDLWATTSVAKYVPLPDLGKTGVSRKRFDQLWRYIRWSDQPSERPPHMSSEGDRWLLIDDFVERFNEYRAATFSPCETICVDESMSRWYGQGGEWINHGLLPLIENHKMVAKYNQ